LAAAALAKALAADNCSSILLAAPKDPLFPLAAAMAAA